MKFIFAFAIVNGMLLMTVTFIAITFFFLKKDFYSYRMEMYDPLMDI